MDSCRSQSTKRSYENFALESPGPRPRSRGSTARHEAEVELVGRGHAEPTRGRDPPDFVLWDLEGLRELADEAGMVHLPGREDHAASRAGGNGAHGPRHDLPMALVLDLADPDRDGGVVKVVPLPPDYQRPARQELPALRLLAHLFRENPVRTPAREPGGPGLPGCEREPAPSPGACCA